MGDDVYLLLAKIVWQVGNHDLRLARHAILWWTTLLARLLGLGLSGLTSLEAFAILRCERLVGCGGEWSSLAWYVCRASAVGGRLSLAVSLTLASTPASTATASASTASAASGVATLRLFLAALGSFSGRLGLAGKLDGNLAIQDGLAVQLVDCAFGLRRGGDVYEGVADWASRARVGWD